MTQPLLLGPDVSTTAFRRALGAFASGVTVVTTTVDGELYGMTVSAFTSLSLDPPLVLICVDDRSRGRELLARRGAFCVNVLAADQRSVAELFADHDRPRGAAAFDGVPHRPGLTGCPVILDTAAHVDCEVKQWHRGGDHSIVIGAVMMSAFRPHAAPLVVHRREFRALAHVSAQPPGPSDLVAPAADDRAPVALPGPP